MNVQFYINSSPSIKLDKSLTAQGTQRTCDIMGAIDVINPVIVVKGTVDSNINYMQIGAPLNRYYFITAMDYTIAGKVVITGHVDVLKTYKSLIEGTTLNYIRGAGDINEMDDSSYPISDYMVQQYFPMDNWTDIFSNEGSGRHYLLRTICGEAEVHNTVTMTVDQVFWSGEYYQDNGNTYYKCYQLKQSGIRLWGMYAPRQDLTGITQVYIGDYVQVGTDVWQMIATPNETGMGDTFMYLGTTT